MWSSQKMYEGTNTKLTVQHVYVYKHNHRNDISNQESLLTCVVLSAVILSHHLCWSVSVRIPLHYQRGPWEEDGHLSNNGNRNELVHACNLIEYNRGNVKGPIVILRVSKSYWCNRKRDVIDHIMLSFIFNNFIRPDKIITWLSMWLTSRVY